MYCNYVRVPWKGRYRFCRAVDTKSRSQVSRLPITDYQLCSDHQSRLIDDDGNDISAYGVRGEICVRGPTIIPGYFENPKANAESFDKDGYLKTGDIGYCDEATRKWYIIDRKKELIKVRGFQVAPPELEAVLLSHPQIVDAAVIGVPHPSGNGEAPRAYIVRRPGPEGQKLTEEEVKTFLGSRLAKYKALVGGVKFVDAIAKNPSGKILKRLLREESKKELEAGLSKSKLWGLLCLECIPNSRLFAPISGCL